VALSRIDVMTSDLPRLRIALAAPEALTPTPGGTFLDVKVEVQDQPPVTRTIALEETLEAGELISLPKADRPGLTTHVFRISEDGIEQLEGIRRGVRQARSEKRGGSIAIGVAARSFCLAGPLPKGPLLTTTWMLTSETGDYVVVARNLDLLSDKKVAEGIATMEPCSGQ
jgi:hypothetical protein